MADVPFYRGTAGKDRSLVGGDFPSPLCERDRRRHPAAGPVRVLSQAGLRVPDRFQPGLRAGLREIRDAAGHGNLRRAAARHADHGNGAPPENVRRLRNRGAGTGKDRKKSDHVRLHRPAGADRLRGRNYPTYWRCCCRAPAGTRRSGRGSSRGGFRRTGFTGNGSTPTPPGNFRNSPIGSSAG